MGKERQPSFQTPPPRRRPRPSAARYWVSLILVVVGCGLLGYVGGQYWYMVHTQRQLEASWQTQAQTETQSAPGGTTSVAGASKGKELIRLIIAKIKLEAIVVEGTERQQLIAGPGHLTDTPMPGEIGNAVITAHRDTFFRHIFELEKGDQITVQRGARSFRYEVTGKKVVQPDDLTVLAPTSDAQLTLITCYPIYYIGPAPERLVISSKLVGPQAEPSGTRPAAMY